MLSHISEVSFNTMRAANDTFNRIFKTKFDVFCPMFIEVRSQGLSSVR